ncbi:LysR family transcriptional regulator [Thalassotalea fusca]
MTLDQLNMLVALADTGTLKQASALLHKTQPAISQGIKQLEAQLNVKLFDRSSYRLSLTTAGRKIYHHAMRTIKEANELRQLSVHLARGEEPQVVIAMNASFDIRKIIPMLETMQQQFPQTQIVLKQEYLSGAIESVEEKRADIAITTIDPVKLELGKLTAIWLDQGDLINVASPKLIERHPALASATELINEYQIVVQDSGQSSQGKQFSVQTGQRCWYVNDFNTKHTLIKSGIGWGRLPDSVINRDIASGELIPLQLSDLRTRLPLNYHAIKHKDQIFGPVAESLWQALTAFGEKRP